MTAWKLSFPGCNTLSQTLYFLEASGDFSFETLFPFFARKLRTWVVLWLHYLQIRLQIGISPTFCRMVPCLNSRSLTSSSSAWAKRWGLLLQPCGRTVQVSCCFPLKMRLSYSKTNSNWNAGWKGIEKKASLRSKTKNQFMFPGIWERIVYESSNSEWIGITALLMRQSPSTILCSLEAFLWGRMWAWKGAGKATEGLVQETSLWENRSPCRPLTWLVTGFS